MQLTIPPASRGRRLDQTLAALLPTLSRSQVQRVIRDGRVRVNGAITVRPSEPVTGGEHITLDPPELAPTTPAPQALPLTILYEDSAIGVIDKPAGMVVHPAAGHPDGTLVNALLYTWRTSADSPASDVPASCTAWTRGPPDSWSSPSTTALIAN